MAAPLQANPEFVDPVKAQIHYTKIKYLNNMIEQDHRRVKKITNPALGYKKFNSANNTIAGIEAMAMVRKNQITLAEFNGIKVSIADQINLLAA